MKIINSGDRYQLYSDDNLKTFNLIPSGFYSIEFSKQTGFYLISRPKITINEKIYGNHEDKVNKVLNSFSLFNRNLGVILSGDKGIGKSLFAKMLGIQAVEYGFPFIIVNDYVQGISDFINQIEQECVILFDEFDKTFGGKMEEKNSLLDPQTEMLSLFDGISYGKKLFVITCNNLRSINDYLINRPGRFHYHFRFSYPKGSEIKTFLYENVFDSSEKEIEIDKVVDFSYKVPLNYDCLRAIAFELSSGYSFEDSIKDLNIINTEKIRYSVNAILSSGAPLNGSRNDMHLDFFSCPNKSETLYFDYEGNSFSIDFNLKSATRNSIKDNYIISKKDFISFCYEDDTGEDVNILNYGRKPSIKVPDVEYISIERNMEDALKYF